jgi:hypothetical protein
VSDGTAAVINAAVKAVVRNSFMRALLHTLPPDTVIKEQFIGNIVPRNGPEGACVFWIKCDPLATIMP